MPCATAEPPASDVCAQKTVFQKFKLIWLYITHDYTSQHDNQNQTDVFYQSIWGRSCKGISPILEKAGGFAFAFASTFVYLDIPHFCCTVFCIIYRREVFDFKWGVRVCKANKALKCIRNCNNAPLICIPSTNKAQLWVTKLAMAKDYQWNALFNVFTS